MLENDVLGARLAMAGRGAERGLLYSLPVAVWVNVCIAIGGAHCDGRERMGATGASMFRGCSRIKGAFNRLFALRCRGLDAPVNKRRL